MGIGAVINDVSAGNIYPGYGNSLGIRGSAMTQGSAVVNARQGAMQPVAVDDKTEGGSQLGYAAAIGASGSSVTWWIALAVLLAVLMFGARKLGTGDGDFSNIKPSVYNVLTISFASIIGIAFFKMVFTRFPIPGLTSIVLSV